jgi:predicted HTH domain antitoxin
MVKIPEETLQAAGLPGAEVSSEVNRILILELYHEGKISLGKAAELADMLLADFMDFMAKHNTYLNYGEADLKDDQETL